MSLLFHTGRQEYSLKLQFAAHTRCPGDVNHILPGHNAWVVGNEPVVAIGIEGMMGFAKK